ncbi:hypothetical protein Ddye_002944 [Dipteronia dyeriana]|uniref:Uncharacterized protein n=1 Tax=Dipteronia dyeriana TaxID=168575 RepID=A0AAD9XS50_9ROSI|nr:hypothetical protein Ddye_002944 [Dipteronia dyeriana]
MSGSTNLVSVNFSDSDLEEGKKPLFVEEDTCAELVRYYSTKSGDEMTSLKDYVTRMKEGQKDIYYITGKSKKAVENSPSLERLKKKDYEVLLVVVTVDGYGISQLKEYDGKKLVSATKEGLKLDEDEDESEDRSDIVEEDDGEDTFMHALNNELKNTTLKESFVHANEESSKKIEGASNATDLDMEEPAFKKSFAYMLFQQPGEKEEEEEVEEEVEEEEEDEEDGWSNFIILRCSTDSIQSESPFIHEFCLLPELFVHCVMYPFKVKEDEIGHLWIHL